MYNKKSKYFYYCKEGSMEGIYHMQLFCSEYGNGRIVNWGGKRMTVRFEQGEIDFWFPLAFYGALSATNEEDERKIKELIRRWTVVNPPEKVKFPDVQQTHYIKIYRTALEESGLLTVSETKNEPEPSAFTAGVLEFFAVEFVTALVSMVTFGIAAPFMIAWQLRWMAEGTVYSGRQTEFDGEGTELFMNYIKWWLLSVITLGIYAALYLPLNMNRWTAEHTHFKDAEARSYFDGTVWQLFGVTVVSALVPVVTLGIGSFWAYCYRERWLCDHTVIGGKRLNFTGTAMEYFIRCLKWYGLTFITLGIYGFWLPLRAHQWAVSHTITANT